MSSISDAVTAGAHLLDASEEVPDDWYRYLNVETLDVASPTHCVLGQLFENYAAGLDALGIKTAAVWGFNAWGDEDGEHYALTREWVRVVRERLTAAQ